MNIEDDQIDIILDIINALNDKTRQKIIMIFSSNSEYRVSDIAENFTLSRPTISHHLNLMRRSKILKSRKEGKEIFYSFNKEFVVKYLNALVAYFESCC